MAGIKRDADSINWIMIRAKHPMMLGFAWSTDWLSLTPWTVGGEARPFLGVTREFKGTVLFCLIFWIGPLMVQFVKRTTN